MGGRTYGVLGAGAAEVVDGTTGSGFWGGLEVDSGGGAGLEVAGAGLEVVSGGG